MSTNDITGDTLISRSSTDAYRDGWDRIFKKPVVTTKDDQPDTDEVLYNGTSTTGGSECPEITAKASSQ